MKSYVRFVGNLLIVLILFAILFSYAMFQGGFASWFLLFSFLPIFLYQLGLFIYPIHRWKVTRKISHQSIQSGDSLFITIEVDRLIPFPLYYCVIEEIFPESLQKTDHRQGKYVFLNNPEELMVHREMKVMKFPWFRRKIFVDYQLDHIPRGEHQLSNIRVRTGDVFGLIKKEYHFQVFDVFLAFPRQLQISLNDRLKHMDLGSIASNAWHMNHSNVVTGVREYIPGDKYSWIHWKQSAKNNQLMTKEFEREKNADILLVLDLCNENDFNHLAFEGAIELTYSLLMKVNERSFVSLLIINDHIEHFLVSQNVSQIERVRQYLTTVQPTESPLFAHQLQEALTDSNRQSMTFLVTTQMDLTLMQTVQQLTNQFEKIAIVMIQSSNRISANDHRMIEQLQSIGIFVSIFTEDELTQKTLEVNI